MDERTTGKNKQGIKKSSQLTVNRLSKHKQLIGGTSFDRCQNQRSGHRHTVELDTEVHFREQSLDGMFRCRTSNIGLNGAYLSAECLPITPRTEINLVFHARTRPVPKQYRMPAKVVRMTNRGAALVFCPEDDEQVQDFRRFLLKAKIAARK